MNAAADQGFVMVGGEKIAFSVVRSRKRRRTVAFTMQPDATLRVLAPNATSLSSVVRILQQRSDWLARKLAERRTKAAAPQFTDGATLVYLGHAYRLHVTQGREHPQSCRVTPRNIRVHVSDATLSPVAREQEVQLEIRLWMKKRAKVKLKKRMDVWAQRLGVTYRQMMVTDPQRRWGSCSVDNVIRLNWRLMLAPLPIVDYVVAHELCHIRHKDHSPRFWAALARAMPDYKQRRSHLRRIESGLML